MYDFKTFIIRATDAMDLTNSKILPTQALPQMNSRDEVVNQKLALSHTFGWDQILIYNSYSHSPT
jgi:hypothetical protein